jgi:hypothetical protein
MSLSLKNIQKPITTQQVESDLLGFDDFNNSPMNNPVVPSSTPASAADPFDSQPSTPASAFDVDPFSNSSRSITTSSSVSSFENFEASGPGETNASLSQLNGFDYSQNFQNKQQTSATSTISNVLSSSSFDPFGTDVLVPENVSRSTHSNAAMTNLDALTNSSTYRSMPSNNQPFSASSINISTMPVPNGAGNGFPSTGLGKQVCVGYGMQNNMMMSPMMNMPTTGNRTPPMFNSAMNGGMPNHVMPPLVPSSNSSKTNYSAQTMISQMDFNNKAKIQTNKDDAFNFVSASMSSQLKRA